MSLGTATSPVASREHTTRRKFQRLAFNVPVNVVVLKSGVPATIPGRAMDVSQGGISTVIAGELRPGEVVGMDFRLSPMSQPIQAKAVVRHSSLMKHGMQFLAIAPEHEKALRTWLRMSGVDIVDPLTAPRPSTVPAQAPVPQKTPKRRRMTWPLVIAGITLAGLLAGFAWWGWNGVWSEAVDASESNALRQENSAVVDVPSAVMEQRLIHRALPIYPAAAMQAKTEGIVVLDTVIGTDGSVQHVQPISGPDTLSGAAVDAVKWWRFEPYQKDGRAVRAHTMLEVDFRLSP